MDLQHLKDQLDSAHNLLKQAKKDGIWEWGILEIERYVKECMKAYTKALKQHNN